MVRSGVELSENLDSKIDQLVTEALAELHPVSKFVPGETNIPVTGKVFGPEELQAATKAGLDFWLTSGPYTEKFESRFAKIVGMRHAFMVNSGSSANLVLIAALKRRFNWEDEVVIIVSPVGFATTM